METRDQVLIIRELISGFSVHGPFSDNAEAFAYAKRHAERFPGDRVSHGLKLVNFDTMTEEEVSKYEREVRRKWAELEDPPLEDIAF